MSHRRVFLVFTLAHFSVYLITSHICPLNCYFSNPKKWGFAGCKVWVKSWIGKTFPPAVCTEADEGIWMHSSQAMELQWIKLFQAWWEGANW